jgi:hypothetical protein
LADHYILFALQAPQKEKVNELYLLQIVFV